MRGVHKLQSIGPMARPLVAIAIVLGSTVLAGRRADAQDPPIAAPQTVLDGHSLRVTTDSSVAVVDIGCEGRLSLRLDNRLFVACGSDGVVEINLSNPLIPRRVGRMPIDGEATGLVVRDGRVWVAVSHAEMLPVLTEVLVSAAAQTAFASSPVPTPSVPGTTPVGSPETKRSLLAPPRRGALWELSAMAGAFVNGGEIGGGAIGWASAVYRFDAPLVVRAELAPLGFAIGQSVGGTIGTLDSSTRAMTVAAAHVLAGVDTQFVEVAVGGGAASISTNSSLSTSRPTGGASIVEEGRVGARDGLALNLETITVAANNRFAVGSFAATVQVPVTPNIMLMLRGGAGAVGVFYGDLGARVIVRGDGGPDTIALTGFFGAAGIDFRTCYPTEPNGAFISGTICANDTSVGGPSLGGGVEWRR